MPVKDVILILLPVSPILIFAADRILGACANLQRIVSGAVRACAGWKKIFPDPVRICVYLGLLVTAINYLHNRKLDKVDWTASMTLVLLTVMIAYWAWAAVKFLSAVTEQEHYFSQPFYGQRYRECMHWRGLKPASFLVKTYYGVWLLVSGWILCSAVQIGLIRHGLPLEWLNLILLGIVIVLSGNSVLSTLVMTYFIGYVYYGELHARRKNPDGALAYNPAAPDQTEGVRKLLADARSHSTAFLFFSMCFLAVFALNLFALDPEHIRTLWQGVSLPSIACMVLLVCVGVYILITLAPRYYLNKLVELWKDAEISGCRREVEKLDPVSRSGDMDGYRFWSERIRDLQKHGITLIPGVLEILYTFAIGVLSAFITSFFK